MVNSNLFNKINKYLFEIYHVVGTNKNVLGLK